MGDSTIKVPDTTRDHLAALARERGMTIGGLVTALANQEHTAEQLAERVRQSRRLMRDRGIDDSQLDAMPSVLENAYAIAAEKSVQNLKRGTAA
ncbi:hypothetical protein AB0442_41385 [Kitasatospora sp. NPDC085895]|uniref:hypothetical protein n=1 Tax=Kitasatospora sp. NPDC085895 TaxID=3155057 RepID=UPI00344DF30C